MPLALHRGMVLWLQRDKLLFQDWQGRGERENEGIQSL